MGMKWNPIVVWICVSLMTNEAEHLFMEVSGCVVSLLGHIPSSFASSVVTDPSVSAVS